MEKRKMAKKERKLKKLFDVEFGKNIIDSVINHYIEGVDEKDRNDKTIMDAINYGVEITMGRIIHEATPRIVDSMKYDFPGYRITVEMVTDEMIKPLDIVDSDKGLIINTKIKKSIDF